MLTPKKHQMPIEPNNKYSLSLLSASAETPMRPAEPHLPTLALNKIYE